MIPLDPIWAIYEPSLLRVQETVRAAGVEAMRLPAGYSPPSPLRVDQGIAVIELSGPMLRRAGMYQAIFDASSTDQLREAVEAAAADPQIAAILMLIDSPGGSVAGLAELADALMAAREEKPVWGQVAGMAASAAYYVGSQVERLFAQRMDMIGSIGTRLMLYDYSRFFQNLGVEAVPIDTGPFKSAGALGTEITAAQRADFQRLVDGFYEDFLATIVRGRGLSLEAVRSLADGRMFHAAEAVGIGLIDGLQNTADTLQQLRVRAAAGGKAGFRVQGSDRARNPEIPKSRNPLSPNHQPPISNQPSTSMSEAKDTAAADAAPQAATAPQLKSACPGADKTFLFDQLERGATIEQARDTWIAEQQKRLEASQKELADLKASASSLKAQASSLKLGVKALGSGTKVGAAIEGDPIVAWNEAVQEKIRAGFGKAKAVAAVAHEQPELHQSYVAAFNTAHKRPLGRFA